MKDYDVIIIGAGVSGCAIARELAKGKLRIAVLEAKSRCLRRYFQGKQRHCACGV